jgi:hypothetical protein
MTRIKLLAISTTAAVMILGSSLVLAAGPAADTADTASDPAVTTPASPTDVAAAGQRPARRGGGGSGKALRK